MHLWLFDGDGCIHFRVLPGNHEEENSFSVFGREVDIFIATSGEGQRGGSNKVSLFKHIALTFDYDPQVGKIWSIFFFNHKKVNETWVEDKVII